MSPIAGNGVVPSGLGTLAGDTNKRSRLACRLAALLLLSGGYDDIQGAKKRQARTLTTLLTLLILTSGTSPLLLAQTGGTCIPVSERGAREMGCFITAREVLNQLPQVPLFWHLDSYATHAAADAARGPNGTVVESLGKIWSFTIAQAGWRSNGEERIAEIGPLPLVKAEQYAAVYMEGVFEPGMASVVHRHPGAEAWYTPAGEMCVETPRSFGVRRWPLEVCIWPGQRPSSNQYCRPIAASPSDAPAWGIDVRIDALEH